MEWLIFIFLIVAIINAISGDWEMCLELLAVIAISYTVYLTIIIIKVRKKGFFSLKYRDGECYFPNDVDCLLQKIVQGPVIIDSNIWGEPKLDYFWKQIFRYCQVLNSKIIIPGGVYDEIEYLACQTFPGIPLKYWEKTDEIDTIRSQAQIAKKRLMKFSNNGFLFVPGLEEGISINSADPAIIQMCENMRRRGTVFYLLTNNDNLIFRVRQILDEDLGKEHCRIISVHPTKYAKRKYIQYLYSLIQRKTNNSRNNWLSQ